MRRTVHLSLSVLGLVGGLAVAQSNIDNSVPDKFAWGENVGWTNWRDANGGLEGVNVGAFVMSGYIWGENIGFINVGDGTPTAPPYYANVNGTDFGVNIDPDGDLHGYAWSENGGWINFDGGALATPPQPARIECGAPLARLTGYVWAENFGWINLDVVDAGKFVAIELTSTPLVCDLNDDGDDNGADIQLFIGFVLNGGADWRAVCSGDVEGTPDGVLDFDDVAPFVSCLLSKP